MIYLDHRFLLHDVDHLFPLHNLDNLFPLHNLYLPGKADVVPIL